VGPMRALHAPACPLCGGTAHAEVARFPELAFVRCGGCGLVYKREQAPGLGQGYEAAYFEKGGAGYLRRWAHRVRKCRRQLLAALEYAPHAQGVLDVGCSAGYVLEAAARLGLSCAGTDASRYAVDLCRGQGYRAEVGTLEALPFPDAAFDIVTAKHTLEHTPTPLRALEEMRRVLRPGGVVLLVVPDVSYWRYGGRPRTGSAFRPDRLGWQHSVYFGDQTLADACRRVRLTPVLAGKAVFRSRLASGWRRPLEVARWALLVLWTRAARALRLRREIQLIARKETPVLVESPP